MATLTPHIFPKIEELMNGEIPTRVHKLIKQTLKAIDRHQMLLKDEPLIIGISGGKDSLSLALLLALANKFYPKKHPITAIQVDWAEFPMSQEYKTQIKYFFEVVETPYEILTESIEYFAKEEAFNCYGCSRARRKRLFERAQELNIQKIAFGHHLDDMIETSLMNLISRGDLSPLKATSPFWNDLFCIIRPLIEIPEHKLKSLSEFLDFPILEIECPNKAINLRNDYQPLLKMLEKIDPLYKNHIYQAYYKLKI